MMLLTKEEFLETAGKLKYEDVPVDELKPGACVRVQELSGTDRDLLEGMTTFNEDGTLDTTALRAKTLALSIVNDKGEKIFTSKEVEKLGEMSARVLVKLYAVASRLSGMGKEVADVEKNSESPEDQGGSSFSV